MHLRQAGVDDIDAIMEVLEDGRASLAKLGIDQWQGGYPHRSNIEWDVSRGESYILVEDTAEGEVVLASAMVGFHGEAIYDHIEDGAWLTSSDSKDPRYIVIHRVAVSGKHQGKGIGRMLLKTIENAATGSGAESLRIETHPQNIPMIRLIENSGFTRCGIVRITHAENGVPERIAYEKLLPERPPIEEQRG